MTLLSFLHARPSHLAARLAPARSSLRQAQNPFPLAEARILRRRFAPLTPLRARAVFSALALAKQEKVFVSAIVAIALMFPLGLSAQESAPHRLMAETVRLDADPASNPQLAIWRDKLGPIIAERKRSMASSPAAGLQLAEEFFSTHFLIDGHTYFVSAIHNSCGDNDLLPHSISCSARVAEVIGGRARIVAEIEDLWITSERSETGYDAKSNKQTRFMTFATFNAASRTITFTGVEEGRRTPGVNVHVP